MSSKWHLLTSFVLLIYHSYETSFVYLRVVMENHSVLQEDGKKIVQLKPNCLFEHDKDVCNMSSIISLRTFPFVGLMILYFSFSYPRLELWWLDWTNI